ncbi:dCTP deaminase protein [Rhizobium phage RHph_I1_6]|uniref:dCTP deaminase protein n=1 Tax=Rhizobium phage RHph_I1_6 TaxID=2509728 RepID=A0A7S5RJP8_9CAUD|nr:dCTP deaminase [Rhizobium phage RHph_I1_6]QIG76570.1 dCTP deaminase protein [Rhizobium phage RHph_I1_6]
MIINGAYLKLAQPIINMLSRKVKAHGVSHGLSEVGYDIRIKQRVEYHPPNPDDIMDIMENYDGSNLIYHFRKDRVMRALYGYTRVFSTETKYVESIGRTALASSIEQFELPADLWGELRNKSTHARCFLDATLGTDMEPGWKGFLTIELVFHGMEPVTIEAGCGIAKAVFHELKDHAKYDGKYQSQPDSPVPPIFEQS